MAASRTLAFEIGTEEIPAFDLKSATEKMPTILSQALEDSRISHGDIQVYSTPRRMACVVADVADAAEEVNETFKGPSVKIAFGEDGNPTKAAIGFARGKGVDVESLEVKEEGGVEYVFASRNLPSEPTMNLLPSILQGVIKSLPWPKSMKWASCAELFSRPVRWIVALFGEEVVPLSFAGAVSGRHTDGHRVLSPAGADIPCAEDYEKTIRSLKIIPTQEERRRVIVDAAERFQQELGAGHEAVLPEKTLTEVINLSEAPTPMLASFDEAFLAVPEEIIVDAMLMHQRYFPIYKDGKLTNRFIIVSNGDPAHQETIVDGNQRVVAARLYDAKFFYEEDLKRPLEDYVARLDEVVFQEKLGTMRDKTQRIGQLAERICLDAEIDAAIKGQVMRAAYLAKADLVTNAVVEFTSVQGIMGSYYAEACGEDAEVARAIADHYRPRFSGDEIPEGLVGKMVALADKLDTVCGLFAIGQLPTGSSDPFALRRAALGIISILESGLDVSLDAAIADSLRIYQESGLDINEAEAMSAIQDFFVTRTKVLLKDGGSSTDAIEAVCATNITEPVEIILRVRALDAAKKESPKDIEDLSTAYARANNLRDADEGTLFDESVMDASEAQLAHAIKEAKSAVNEALDADDYPSALAHLASLRAPIDSFFESTMIMDEDLAKRANRMKLLNAFVDVFANVADFGQLSPR
ncbi:MAG: glycine--tRNA ligase subunit beta [Eggerthellaceae bacterium]|nr:glycine--tRNA ligase subunit beta [Eggerthellaceae bacterium]